VWYMTPQSFFLNSKAMSPHNLIIVDEAHLHEPAYMLLIDFLKKLGQPCIFVTATPTDHLTKASAQSVNLETARLWTVQTKEVVNNEVSDLRKAEDAYLSWSKDFIENQWHNAKVLIFVPSVIGGRKFAERLKRKCYLLHSKTEAPSDSDKWDVIISTSVADAGMTLPNVDTVITWDHDISIVSDGLDSKVSRYRLTSQTIAQRAGRTGRTNNGTAWVYRTPHVRSQNDPGSVVGSPEQIFAWLETGISPHIVNFVNPGYIRKVLDGNEKDAHFDSVTDWKLAKDLAIFMDNLQPLIISRLSKERMPLPNDDDEYTPFDYTAAGVVSEQSTISISKLTRATIESLRFISANSDPSNVDLQRFEEVFEPVAELKGVTTPFLSLVKAINPNWAKWAEQVSDGEYLPPLPKGLGKVPAILSAFGD